MRFFPLAQNFCFAWGTWVARKRGGERRLWSLNPKSDPPLNIFYRGIFPCREIHRSSGASGVSLDTCVSSLPESRSRTFHHHPQKVPWGPALLMSRP